MADEQALIPQTESTSRRNSCLDHIPLIALIIILTDFGYKVVVLAGIHYNPFFEPIYSFGYTLCLIPLLVAAIFALVYMCGSKDRKIAQGAMVFAAVANLLVGTWVLIYCYSIDERDKIRLHKG